MKNPVYETILRRRSIRRFRNQNIPYEILERCVDAARLAPSAKNLQPLEYIVVDEKDVRERVFDTLGWASNLPDGRPPSSNQPRAYIVIIVDTDSIPRSGYAGYKYDVGLSAGNICLTALEKGIGSCILASVERRRLRGILKIPENYNIELVIALGYPAEEPVAEDAKDSITYYRDRMGTIHVPKRRLKDILHRNRF